MTHCFGVNRDHLNILGSSWGAIKMETTRKKTGAVTYTTGNMIAIKFKSFGEDDPWQTPGQWMAQSENLFDTCSLRTDQHSKVQPHFIQLTKYGRSLAVS